MNEDLKSFFEDVKEHYKKENHDFSWSLESMESKANEDILFFLAFNLSKNVIHGPLPDRLHNRMALVPNKFSKAYFRYLDGENS